MIPPSLKDKTFLGQDTEMSA